MGIKVTLKSSDGSRSRRQRSPSSRQENSSNVSTETSRAREEEEKRRKAEETRARRQREQELEAVRERERQRLAAAIEEEEKRRNIAEVRTLLLQEHILLHTTSRVLQDMRERERQRLEAEARRAGEEEEERGRAEETRARRQREQELEAVRERERQRLEAEARRAGEEEEERRRAEETRARRQREQELEAMQEQTIARPEVAMEEPLDLFLPEVCHHHSTRQGCPHPNCRRLHICRLFLADICKHGVTCRYGHSLTTVHNQLVCNLFHLDTAHELVSLQQLRCAFDENDEIPEAIRVNNLETCDEFASESCCYRIDCNRIHICRQYVAGACGRANCRFGHDLHTTHNNEVLSRHRLTTMTDDQILNILREKDTGGTQRVNGAAAAASSAENGAIPRQPPNGATHQTSRQGENNSAVAGVSEELQCPVCLEMFNSATTLGCGHTFCAGCLQEVRDRIANRCPLCRVNISSATRSVALDNIIRSMTARQ